MKNKTLSLLLALILATFIALNLGCSSNALQGEGESPPQSENRCGDGVCDGPENAQKCPEDCQEGEGAVPADQAGDGGISPTVEGADQAGDGGISPTLEGGDQAGDGGIPPIYVTLAGHIEDVPVYTNCDAYPDFREKLLTFAETFSGTGAAINLQIEYEFFVGAAECETEAMQAGTNGQNVIDYLATQYGYEIDAHQEGGWEEETRNGQTVDNYADIRYLGERVTSTISENVGGMVWDDPGQFIRLSRGEPGQLYPDYVWHPQTLTLAVSHQHHQGNFSRDDFASGVWKPSGHGESFWEHDPQGTLIYIGPGEHANWSDSRPWQSTPEFVETVAAQLRAGELDPNKMYTASIAIPQSILFYPEEHQKLLDVLEQLAPLIESGQAVYVTYSQAVEIWQTEYDSQPNIFFREGMTRPYEIAP